MAQGRMLKKAAISKSRRLGELSSDSPRLLYTWLLPHLDIEGRCHADPHVVKGNVVPRIKTFTPGKIAKCLKELDQKKLIILYSVDGDQYLQFRKFKEHQKLDPKKEAKSKIPPHIPDLFDSCSEVTPESSEVTPPEVKLSEDNINKDKKEGRFTPPTRDQVLEAFKSKKIPDYELQTDLFMNHYQSNGWIVGKTKMKSWTHSVAGWILRPQYKNSHQKNHKVPTSTQHREYKPPAGKPFADEKLAAMVSDTAQKMGAKK